MGGARENYFYNQDGENKNIGKVIYQSNVPNSSIGWTEQSFFRDLGSKKYPAGSNQRSAEQEYLLQGMVKGAMYEASQIARNYQIGIAARPTGVLAHMGIESGDPTKAQEFKNKTSKELDLYLCDELGFKDLGAVVHYNPRAGWNSKMIDHSAIRLAVPPPLEATDSDWAQKKMHIQSVRLPALVSIKQKLSTWPANDSAPFNLTAKGEEDLKRLFKDRAKEYGEEDYDYRCGHYAPYTELVGPFIRLKARPQVNMIGDHDLFGFTHQEYGKLVLDDTLGHVQLALQQANSFQAQHGGIWNWRPKEEFHKSIKAKIMSAHSPMDGDPLVYILPDGQVTAAFYIREEEKLRSVWDVPGATKWLQSTHSGRESLKGSAASAG
jgi:hypothetical protein